MPALYYGWGARRGRRPKASQGGNRGPEGAPRRGATCQCQVRRPQANCPSPRSARSQRRRKRPSSSPRPTSGVRAQAPKRLPPLARTMRKSVVGSGAPFSACAPRDRPVAAGQKRQATRRGSPPPGRQIVEGFGTVAWDAGCRHIEIAGEIQGHSSLQDPASGRLVAIAVTLTDPQSIRSSALA
jgi:hypothetical protein